MEIPRYGEARSNSTLMGTVMEIQALLDSVEYSERKEVIRCWDSMVDF